MTISVIIPVYNRAHLISETLDSILGQTLPPDEIIVVDDGSTDGTPAVVAGYGDKVSLIEQTKNSGPGAARNLGLSRATGTHVIFFDSDDLMTPDYLASRADVARATGAEIVYGAWMPVFLDKGVCRHDGFIRQSRAVSGDPLSAFLRSWVLLLQNCLIETQVVRDVGGYPEDLVTGEDMLLLFRMLNSSMRTAYAAGSLLLLRQHPEGQISASTDLASQRLREELIMTARVLEELGDPGPHAAASRSWRARRSWELSQASAGGPHIAKEFGEPSAFDQLAGRLWQLRRRMEAKLSARTHGHRIPKFFEPAPITAAHLQKIQSLGFTPEKGV